MTVEEVMRELETLGSEQIRNIYANHGNVGHILGVRIGDMKPLVKRLKEDQETALALYETGCLDAMYLAGLVADGAKMSTETLEHWAATSRYSAVADYTVAWVACENPQARELALRWMDSEAETTASSGWHTYSGIVATRPDADLDMAEIERLLDRVERDIHAAPNRVRSAMNGFVISVGTYVRVLVDRARRTATTVGPVHVDVGKTSCKVPDALEYIRKAETAGRVGKKRKTMKC